MKKIVIFDDAQALADKTNFVYDKGIGGIMFWEFNEDDSGELVRAIADAADAREKQTNA